MTRAMMETVSPQEKSALRRRMTQLRDGLDGSTRAERGDLVAMRLAALDAFRTARSIGIYYSTGSEVQTVQLIQRLVEEEGRDAFLPFNMNGELQMTEWRPSDPVVVAPYVGFQPRFSRVAPLERIDVMIVPGLAFDAQGHRLGSGEGLYDRLLARMGPTITRIGIGYHAQVVPSVPLEDGDERVDAVVTDQATIECPRRTV
jgi:5-formyltetrahydrofolate cyclo-ligase